MATYYIIIRKGMRKLSERKRKWVERTVANNRGYKLYLYNRLAIILLLILAQLVGYIVLLYLFAYNSAIGVTVQLTVGSWRLWVCSISSTRTTARR